MCNPIALAFEKFYSLETLAIVWDFFFDDPIVFFTFALVLIGAYQARQLKNTIITMKDSSEKQIRAYVGLVDIKMPLMFYRVATPGVQTLVPESSKVIITVQNGGQTPATNLTSHINYYWVPYNEQLPTNFNYPDYETLNQTISKLSLNPNESTHFNIPLDVNVVTKAVNKINTLYIYGRITYKDVNGSLRTTTFCKRFDPENNLLITQNEYNDLL